MAKILGLLSAGLLVLTFGKYIWRRVPALKKQKKGLKWMEQIHPYAASALVVMGLFHGMKAFGFNFLFTGHVLLIFIIVNLAIGGILNKRIRKSLLIIHRRFSFILVGMMLIHNLFKFIL